MESGLCVFTDDGFNSGNGLSGFVKDHCVNSDLARSDNTHVNMLGFLSDDKHDVVEIERNIAAHERQAFNLIL